MHLIQGLQQAKIFVFLVQKGKLIYTNKRVYIKRGNSQYLEQASFITLSESTIDIGYPLPVYLCAHQEKNCRCNKIPLSFTLYVMAIDITSLHIDCILNVLLAEVEKIQAGLKDQVNCTFNKLPYRSVFECARQPRTPAGSLEPKTCPSFSAENKFWVLGCQQEFWVASRTQKLTGTAVYFGSFI